MTSSEADVLISDLSTGKAGIHGRISAYLLVFKEPLKTCAQKQSLITDYFPFLNRALTLLRRKLGHPSKLNEKFAAEWFAVYRLCVDCIAVISRILTKPLLLLDEGFKILRCFARWRRWEDGEREGLAILKGIKEMQRLPVSDVTSNLYLPDLDADADDAGEATLLAKTVPLLFVCAAKNKKPKHPDQYHRLYHIATEFHTWTSVLDKDPRQLVLEEQASYLATCTIFLVGKVDQFDSKFDLASKFCDLIITTSVQGSPHLTKLCDSLYQIGVRMFSNKEFKQASDTLKLYCQATWLIIEGKLKEAETRLSNYYSLELFGKWCEASTLLLQVLSQSEGTHAVQGVIKDWAEKWAAEHFSNRLPGPISLVEQWVEIQVKLVKGHENGDDVGTLLGNLFLSSSKVSRKKILQQELLFYVQMQNDNPNFCKRMQMMIKDLLEKDGFGTLIDWLEESSCLRLCGVRGPKYCTQCLSQALEVASGHQLAVAYCLRSLCTEEYEPNSEKVFQDIQSALAVWSSIPTSDGSMVPENIMKILYSVIDLLSLKGRVDFHCTIYKVMIKIYTQRGVSLNNLLAKLWESRRISHALCPSPVQEAFMSLSVVFGEKLKLTEFWIECFSKSQPLVVGFHNNFSSSQSNITVHNVEEVTSALISSVSESGSYLAGYMYYDLCEKLVSNGRSVEALPYAMEAHRLRVELFKQKFPWSFEGRSEGNHVLVCRSVASELWSFDTNSCDLDICYISPWNALQCYLESILQVGVIHEILGNGAEAEYFLDRGKSLSCSHSLTLFNIVFSSFLGELYHKKQRWASAKKELQSSRELLKDGIIDGFCSKCKVIVEVTVTHNLADLYQSPISEIESASAEKLSTDLYKETLAKLHTSEWKKSIACLEEQDGTILVKDGNSQLEGSIECNSPNTLCTKELSWDLDLQNCVVSFGGDVPCICKTMGCWHCLTGKVTKSGLVTDAIKLKWELVHRRLSLKLLTGLGKCLENDGQIHEACEIIFQSISVLVGPNPFCRASKSTFLPDTMGKEISAQRKHINLYHLMGREIPGDMLNVERAVILYNLCWLSLKDRKKDTRNNPHVLIDIPISKLVSWLMLSFVLCREVPALFQKVSRLLAAIFSLSTSSVLEAPLSTSCKDLCGRHWVCFFHQASLGIQFNYLFSMKEVQQGADTKGSHMASGAQSLPRLAPESILNLKDFVKEFFEGLPGTTVICLSLLGCPYTSMFQELLSCSSAPAWIMVSRLNLKNLPIHILLPVHSVPGDGVTISGENDGGQWCCPWGSTVVDDVAPNFRMLLEENFNLAKYELALSPAEKKDHIYNVWEARRRIDDRLCTLLKNLEDSWFGSTLKYVLLGEVSNCKDLDTLCENLVRKLKSQFTDIDSSLLKVIVLGVSKYGFKGGTEQVMLEFCLKKGSFFSDVHFKDDHCADELRGFASKLHEAVKKVKGFNRIIKPIILVPDFDVQMLPWENLPVLKNQEVYRMPSVWSILAAYRNERKINPLDAYYLLNPDGSLNCKPDFDKLFRDNKLKGKVGHAPPTEKLAAALESRDLFIYIGHGDGSLYIPNDRIERLQNCAGAFLMGCSSASLKLDGCYVPRGPPLSYLLAGSPVILGNLWEVTGLDIDKFTHAMLVSWFKDRSYRKDCDQKLMIGTCMSRARDKCSHFPCLVGASPVCYGVPTELKGTMEVATPSTELSPTTCLGK
ncbi:separase-like isoform X2 [Rosa chinensis]|uniref:separase-like isoform X2 n=1 Tax=Rosa chinensis TaxID=74649 RepID=UPI001AD8F70F|nr:separase-like isoform X2 [Rosa chinensis]